MSQNLISVCICTYKRPEMLARTLDSLKSQVTNNEFLFEIVVIDNDNMRSAETVVKRYQGNGGRKVVYDCEPEQNIALARNLAVRNAGGNYIAFIDDDEVPIKEWLYNLFNTLKTFAADGVLGPVLPFYTEGAPKWLVKCKVFDRRRFTTGTKLTGTRDTRTGNVLLSRPIMQDGDLWFDTAFGRTGGEDVDFFGKQIAKGRIFVWCDEAVAYETIPPERWNNSFHIKRDFRMGTINGERMGKQRLSGLMTFIKYIIAIPIWLVIFVAFLPFGKHKWFQGILKLAYFSGSVLAFCGVSFLRERE